jgi:hypothetical protein
MFSSQPAITSAPPSSTRISPQNCSGVKSGGMAAIGGVGGKLAAPALGADEVPAPAIAGGLPPAEPAEPPEPPEPPAAGGGMDAVPAPDCPPAARIWVGAATESGALTGSPHALSVRSPSSSRRLLGFRKDSSLARSAWSRAAVSALVKATDSRRGRGKLVPRFSESTSRLQSYPALRRASSHIEDFRANQALPSFFWVSDPRIAGIEAGRVVWVSADQRSFIQLAQLAQCGFLLGTFFAWRTLVPEADSLLLRVRELLG